MEPLVSIVVPVYNASQFLESLLETVNSQEFKNYELILVDDCSTDRSEAILEEASLRDPRIVVVKHEHNRGAPQARNTGVDRSKGKYLAFLDADDLWLPNKLTLQIEFMKSKNCAFSFTDYAFTASDGVKKGSVVKMPSQITYKEALRRSPIFTSTTMFDMEKISKADLMMPEIKIGEDTLTWWNILKKYGSAYALQETLSYYRRSPNTLSANKLHAMACRWRMYREFEKLSLPKSIFYFMGYIKFAVERRV